MVQHADLDHTAVVASALSFGSNANSVSSVSAGGASGSVSRADHVHVGVRSLTHTSNTLSGPITIAAQGSIGITVAGSTISLNSVGGSGSGSGDNPVTWTAGTSMPGGPAANQRITRTDLGVDAYYDGTRWLSVTEHWLELPAADALIPVSATSGIWRSTIPHAGARDLWLVDAWLSFFVNGGSALSASHKWVITFNSRPGGTLLATINIDSGASSTYRTSGAVAIGALAGTTNFMFDGTATKTGTPGPLYASLALRYRVVYT